MQTPRRRSAARQAAELIWRGVEIQRPPVTPVARVRRGVRMAVKEHMHKFKFVE
jgi:hypothetical protein